MPVRLPQNPRSGKRTNNGNFTTPNGKRTYFGVFLCVEAKSCLSCVVVTVVVVVVGTPSFFCFVWSSLPVVPANFLAKNLTVQSRATGPLPPLRPTFSSLYGFSQLSITAGWLLSPLKHGEGLNNGTCRRKVEQIKINNKK